MRNEYLNGGDIDAQIQSLQLIVNSCLLIKREFNHDAAIHPRDYTEGYDSKEITEDTVKWSQAFKQVLSVQHYCEKRMEELFDLKDRHDQSSKANPTNLKP